MTKTWFNITFIISTISQFANNFAQEYVAAIKHIFRYIRKYFSLGIIYKKSNFFFLHGYINSDWAMDPITRYLTTGYLFTIASNVISVLSNVSTLSTYTKTKHIDSQFHLI